jgi:hypothetical protein
LDNPRYTGYAVFGQWTKHESLLDPEDVSAGHVVRFRRSAGDTVVRSRRPGHPAIVSVETFTQRIAARAELDGLPERRAVLAKDVEAVVESLGDMTAALNRADAAHQAQLYQALRLDLAYHHAEHVAVSVAPRVVSARVRGGRAH